MRNLFRAALSFLAIAFWIAVCYGGTVLGLIVWPMLVQEYANVGMPFSRGEILGTGVVLIASWPVFGLTGLWMHSQNTRPKPTQ